MRKDILLIGLSIILISGCIGNQLISEQLAKNSAEVKTFLNEYPHATIIATLFSNISIKEECNNPQLPIKDYYKVTVKDPDTNMTLIVYIDANSQKTVCAIRTGGITENNTNVTEANLTGSARGFGQIQVVNWTYYSNGELSVNVLNRVGGTINLTNISTTYGNYEIPNGILINSNQVSNSIRARLTPPFSGDTKSSYNIVVSFLYNYEGGTFSSTGTLTGYRDIPHSSQMPTSTPLELAKTAGCQIYISQNPPCDNSNSVFVDYQGSSISLKDFLNCSDEACIRSACSCPGY